MSATTTKTDSKGGFIDRIVKRYPSSPFPIVDTQYITVESADMAEWFGSLYDSLVCVNFKFVSVLPSDTISRDDFILVCRYYTKARISYVYSTHCGKKLYNGFPTQFLSSTRLPKSLRDVLTGIGIFTCQNGAITCCPQPEADPTDDTQALSARVTPSMCEGFYDLVCSGTSSGTYLTASDIFNTTEGTAWWLLSARDPTQNNDVARNSTCVQVFGIFKEWTAVDGLMAAIVQRQYDGTMKIDNQLKWTMEHIVGVSGLRASFNLVGA